MATPPHTLDELTSHRSRIVLLLIKLRAIDVSMDALTITSALAAIAGNVVVVIVVVGS